MMVWPNYLEPGTKNQYGPVGNRTFLMNPINLLVRMTSGLTYWI